MKRPKVSVIILNWNGRRYIRKCLDSVLSTEYSPLEIIVVDNGSSDDSTSIINEEYPQVILIRNDNNVGFCRGNNIGIRRATGDIIVLLNNDTFVDRFWVQEIVKMALDPSVGIIGCKLVSARNGLVQSMGCKEKFLGYWEHIGAGRELAETNDRGGVDVDYVSGAALAVKREVINKIGLLDERFEAYVEEVDWCYRVRRAGYRVVTSNAVVYHYGSASWGSFPLRSLYLQYRNRVLFVSNNYSLRKLLTYLWEYPIRFTYESLYNFLKKQTITHRVAAKTSTRTPVSKLFWLYLLNIFFFYLSLITGLIVLSQKGERR